MITGFLLGCSEKSHKLDIITVEKNFEVKFYNYKFLSADIKQNKSDSVYVSIKFQKPKKEQSFIVNQLYVNKDNKWFIINSGISQVINPLPPLIDKTKEQGLRELKSRNIETDTVLYQYDNLMTPLGGRKVVLDIIYNGKSIVDSSTYIQEGERVTLVLSE